MKDDPKMDRTPFEIKWPLSNSGLTATLTLPRNISPDEFDHMMRVLVAFKPGLVVYPAEDYQI